MQGKGPALSMKVDKFLSAPAALTLTLVQRHAAVQGAEVGVGWMTVPMEKGHVVMPAGSVNCGGHFSETCKACPFGHGANWCHGDCVWSWGSCRTSTGGASSIDPASQWFLWVGGWLLFLVVVFAYATVYKSRVVDELPEDLDVPDEDFDDWEDHEKGLFSVFSHSSTCLWAFFCTPVLAAKNYDVGKVAPYWMSCITLGALMYSPLWLLAAVVRAIWSSRLQRNLRHKTNFCLELLTGIFCFWCAVGRDSLELDEELRAEITCPFNVERTWFQHFVDEGFKKENSRRCCGPSEKGWRENGHNKHHKERSCWSSDKDSRGCCADGTQVPNAGVSVMLGEASCAVGRGGHTRVCGPSG